MTAAEHLHAIIADPYQIDQHEVHLQCSVGYCEYPSDADNADELLQKSNLALFQAESTNMHSVKYETGMQAHGRHLVTVEKEIRHAIANEEFILHFQPQLNLKRNRLEAAEVLVRWQHPEKGLLAPGQFFDDIQALNLFSELDNYVLEKTCQTIDSWYKTYKRRIPLAINITADEFQSPNFIQTIQKLLKKYNIPPIYLELEVTENVVITDIELVMKIIVELQSMGIKVSIDDFGTGYSSLAYLRRLPIDKIKIDRSFIQEVTTNDSDLTIVKTMVELSHGLGKRVLAEGVETKEQLQLLRNISRFILNKTASALSISFEKDKQSSPTTIELSIEYLRVYAPTDDKGKAIGEIPKVYHKKQVQLLNIESVGKHGYRFIFDDGHSNIYNEDYLLTLATEYQQRWQRYLSSTSTVSNSREAMIEIKEVK